jgi:imidazolonepropionase-like amidohydrolase
MKPLISLSSKRIISTVCLATLIFSTAFNQKQTYDMGIIAGTLINGTGNKPLHNKLVLIDSGKIIDIVDAALLKNYNCKTVIDSHDKFVIPGLFDMHGHVTMTNRIIDTTNNNFQWQVKYNRATAEWVLRSLLYFGITNVRETGDFLNEGLALKRDVEANKIAGPHLFACGPLIESETPYFLSMSSVVNTKEEAIAEVQRQAKAGVDIIKIYATVPSKLTSVIINEAHRNNKKVIGHLGATSWSDAVKFGIDGLVHAPTGLYKNFETDSDSTKTLLQAMSERKIENDPTLYVVKCFFQKDSVPIYLGRYLPESIKTGWAQENGVVAKLVIPHYDFDKEYNSDLNYEKKAYEMGVDILAGSDFNNPNTYPGYSLHKELQELTKAGIPNDSLIKIATYKAAEWLGVLNETGTVEKGKDADIIILSKNPLLKIENTLEIDKVIQRGKVIKRDGLLTPSQKY